MSDCIKSFSWTNNLKFVVLLQPRALDRSGRKFFKRDAPGRDKCDGNVLVPCECSGQAARPSGDSINEEMDEELRDEQG